MMLRPLLAIGLAAAALAAPATKAAENSVEAATGLSLSLPINKSQTLRVPRPFARIAVGNAKIADVSPVSRKPACATDE